MFQPGFLWPVFNSIYGSRAFEEYFGMKIKNYGAASKAAGKLAVRGILWIQCSPRKAMIKIRCNITNGRDIQQVYIFNTGLLWIRDVSNYFKTKS